MPGYRLSHLAAADLKAIYRSTERTFGRPQATAYLKGLEAKLELICEQPVVGRARPEIDTHTRSLSHHSHIIYYDQPAGSTASAPILILRVLHGSQDPDRHAFD